MDGVPNIAKIGVLIGDNTRAQILSTLMCGKALTASELAQASGVTAQTATTHLAKLQAGGLLRMRKQGRHKYFALADESIATLLENLMALSASNTSNVLTGPRDSAMRHARVCYNHLAGTKGIELYDFLLNNHYLVNENDNLWLSDSGSMFAQEFGIDIKTLQQGKTPLCRACLDWSERRTHLAGSLGRAFFSRMQDLKWITTKEGSRVVTFTTKGEKAFGRLMSC